MKKRTEPSLPYKLDKIKEPEVIFREVQYFRQRGFWLLLIPSSLVPLIIFLIVLHFSMPSEEVLLFGIVMLLVAIIPPVFFFGANLTVEVRHDGLYIRFFPFHASFFKISASDVKNWRIRSYSALKEYGGYGIRFGVDGKAYNVSGNRGVQIELMDGGKILIGSQKPDLLQQAIEDLIQTVDNEVTC